MKKTNKILNKIFNEELQDISFNRLNPAYLQLLANLGVLDDLESWDLYCKMTDKEYEILHDEDLEVYFNKNHRKFEF